MVALSAPRRRPAPMRAWMALAVITALAVAVLLPLAAADGEPRRSIVAGGVAVPPAPQVLPVGLEHRDFARLPIQHMGRVKPLQSFARARLRALSGAVHLGPVSAVSWLAELLFEPAESALRPVFRIDDRALVDALGLSVRSSQLYSFTEVAATLPTVGAQLSRLRTATPESLSSVELALGELYTQLLVYFEISRSLSMLLPDFRLESTKLASQLQLRAGQDYSYLQMLRSRTALERLAAPLWERAGIESKSAVERVAGQAVPGVEAALSTPGAEELVEPDLKFNARQRETLRLDRAMRRMGVDAFSEILRIVPPQWENEQRLWYSPWSLIKSGLGGPASARQMTLLAQLASAYRDGDAATWGVTTAELRTATLAQLPAATASRLEVEYVYQRLAPFRLSLALYLLAFAVLAGYLYFEHRPGHRHAWAVAAALAGFTSMWGERPPLYRLAQVVTVLAVAVHLTGMLSRVWLLERPPVGTLYESILFVALISGLFGLVLSRMRADGVGLAVSTLSGATLLLLAPYFAGEESLEVLVAVLNTNFWLATHVLTITTGYGLCLAAGIGAHIWLLNRASGRGVEPGADDPAGRALIGVALVAVLFTIFGTILGGIWADQSWGRFWGWDPKENGALLISLWLIFLLHGRIAELLGAVGFAVGLVLLNVVVALAWFGVNLLGIGLHSYGFTSGAALGLGVFCGAEILFALVLSRLARHAEPESELEPEGV